MGEEEKIVAEKQKPDPKIVALAAQAMTNPQSLTPAQIMSMAARILDDQKNDPNPHRASPKKKA
jgi:hypothetical protein